LDPCGLPFCGTDSTYCTTHVPTHTQTSDSVSSAYTFRAYETFMLRLR